MLVRSTGGGGARRSGRVEAAVGSAGRRRVDGGGGGAGRLVGGRLLARGGRRAKRGRRRGRGEIFAEVDGQARVGRHGQRRAAQDVVAFLDPADELVVVAALQAEDGEVAVRVGRHFQPRGRGGVRVLEIDDLDGGVGQPLVEGAVEHLARQQIIDIGGRRRGVAAARAGEGGAGERLRGGRGRVFLRGRRAAQQSQAGGHEPHPDTAAHGMALNGDSAPGDERAAARQRVNGAARERPWPPTQGLPFHEW